MAKQVVAKLFKIKLQNNAIEYCKLIPVKAEMPHRFLIEGVSM